MDKQNKCTNKDCLKGKVAENFLYESEDLYTKAAECDYCLRELMSLEMALTSAKSAVVVHANPAYNAFQETLDVKKAEMLLSGEKAELPLYLKNYREASFQESLNEKSESIIVKMTKNGIKFVDSMIENMSMAPVLNFAPATRATATDTPESYIVLEEQMESGAKITYQIIQESKIDAFLSIKVESSDAEEIFTQANIRKSGRFIQSSRFNDENIVSFSGLQEGKYSVELTSGKSSKKIDFFILIE